MSVGWYQIRYDRVRGGAIESKSERPHVSADIVYIYISINKEGR